MLLKTLLLPILTASLVGAQSRVDLLRHAADFYNNHDTVEIRGEVTQRIPATSWQVVYEDRSWWAQPKFIPVGIRPAVSDWASSVGMHPHLTRADISGKDPAPAQWGAHIAIFGDYGNLARRILSARVVGKETILYKGKQYDCEVVDATYDKSPDFKPNTLSMQRRIYIDPHNFWILKETESDQSSGDITFIVKSIKFDEPPTLEHISALKRFEDEPKTRPAWVGRQMPDLILPDLFGGHVSLAKLRGNPVFIDFWASWCGSCKRATALAQNLASRYAKQGLKVLTITQDTPDDARSWLAFHRLSVSALLDPSGAAWKLFEVPGVPVAILFNDRGMAVKYWTGVDDQNDVRSAVASVVQSRSH